MKRVLALVLTIAMLFGMVPGSVFTKAYAEDVAAAAEEILFIGAVNWNGGEEARPAAVTLTLKQSIDGGETWDTYKGEYRSVSVRAPYWQYGWGHLPAVDEETGAAIKYSVEASNVANFYRYIGEVQGVDKNTYSQTVSYSYIAPAVTEAPAAEEVAQEAPVVEEAVAEEAPAVEEAVAEEAPAAEEVAEEVPAAEEAVAEEAPAAEEVAEEVPAAEEVAEEVPAAEEAVEEAPAAEEAVEEEAPAAEEAVEEEAPAAEEAEEEEAPAAEEAEEAEEEEAPAAEETEEEEVPAVEETEEAAEAEDEEIIDFEEVMSSPAGDDVKAPDKYGFNLNDKSKVNTEVTVTKPADLGGVDVDDTSKNIGIGINLAFNLGASSEEALEYFTWVYDYSSVFAHNDALINVSGNANATGALIYDGQIAGSYSISGTKITIYPDFDVLGDMRNIKATVKLDLELDTKKIHTEEGGDIDFNGDVNHITYNPHVTSEKYVGETAASVHVANGEVFQNAEKDANGNFVIYYKITGQTDRDVNSLTVSDTMTSGQSINGPIKVTAKGVTKTVAASGNSFDIDIKSTFGYAKYVPANTEYVIEYSVTVDKNSDLLTIKNAETWNANNGHEFSSDEVSVKINTYAPFTVTKVWNDGNDQDGLRADYTVTLYQSTDGGKTTNIVSTNVVAEPVKTLDKDTLSYTWENLPHLTEDGKIITYSVDETSVPAGYNKTVSGNTITNKHTPETVNPKGAKTWVDDNNRDGKRPTSIVIILKADGVEVARKTIKPDSKGNWPGWDFGNLPKFKDHGTLINYTIEELPVTGYTTEVNGYNVTNTHTPERINIPVTKVWDDGGDHPASITLTLKNGNTTVKTATVTPDASGNWSYTFENVYKYAGGKVINYTLTEGNITGYTKTISGNATNGFTVTNTKVVNVAFTKVWDDSDNADGLRKNYTVQLYKTVDGVTTAVSGKSMSRTATQLTGSWTNLPEYENGKKITYTVVETGVPTGYTASVDDSTNTITNTHTPEKVHISGQKTWNDKNETAKRPASITVHLFADGKEIASKTVTVADGWKWDFGDLNKNAKGKAIVYTVTEDEVDGYATSINGYNITNTTSTSHSFEKIWNDDNNRDGKRAPYTIVLYANVNGTKTAVDTVVLDENTTSKNWDKLPLYTPAGQVITYTVEETVVPAGYTAAVTEETTAVTKITNTHEPEKTHVDVVKVWRDDGTHPASVTIRLFKDGETEATAVKILTADDNWTYSFTDLYKYEDGSVILYYVGEDAVPSYTTAITGDMENGYTVVNTLNRGGSGTKAWYDYDNKLNTRPASITVILKADGKEVQRRVVTAADGWRWTWDSYPDYAADGHKIVYTIEEVPVPGYKTVINGNSITNILLIDFVITKVWDDDNNRDGVRASYGVTLDALIHGVKSHVLADASGNYTGVSTADGAGEVTLNKNTLTYTWHNLPVWDNGMYIRYTAAETTIPADYSQELVYTGTITDSKGGIYTNTSATVTNTHIPETITIPGHKVWNDFNESTRPESITINLLKNGTKLESKEVNAENGWTWSFGPLFKYEAGKEIKYTITEDAVEGYFTDITGSQSEGFTVINSLETTYTVNKIWNDDEDRDGKRADYKVTLYKSVGGAERVAVNEVSLKKTEESYTWTKLPAYEDGVKITYSVDETLVPAGYTKSVSGSTITNTYEPEKISITVNKIWNDDKNHSGDSVVIVLKADGEQVAAATVKADASGNFSVTFNNLFKYKAVKQLISYTVEEVEVAGYNSVVSGSAANGFTVTNTPITGFTVTKEWDDEEDKYGMRTSYGVTLFKSVDGSEPVAVGSEVTIAADQLSYTWENLPAYENGKKITYTAKETTVPKDYEASYNADFTKITNSYIPVTIDINGTKVWDDTDDTLKKRPEFVTINLYADGEFVKNVTVMADEDGNWNFKFENLRESLNGKKIVYTITEDEIASYKASITGDMTKGFTVKNTLVTDVTAVKVWEDRGDESHRATYGITLYKTVDGVEKAVGKEVKLDKDTLTYTWNDLPVFENGSIITYSIKETSIPAGYQAMYGQDGFTVTNVLLRQFKVVKLWNDNNDESKRGAYGITLYQIINGEKSPVGSEVKLTKAQSEYTWTKLPAYTEDGQPITYTAVETTVTNLYIASYEDAEDGIVMTNTLEQVVSKEFDGLKNGDLLDYSIEVNPDAKKLNDGEPLTVTDTLPQQVEVMRNTVKVICADGHGHESTIAFEEGKLIFKVPDGCHARITYTLQSTAPIGERVMYTNTVEIDGKYFHQTDETKDPEVIQEHSATIDGATDLFTIFKIDAESIKTVLPGAEFELYKCTIDESGKITGASKVGETLTTNAQGKVTFEEVKEFELYYWIEVKAPENYVINENYPHYFVLYQEYSHQPTAAAVVAKVKAANGDMSIRALKGGTGWTVTNKMQTGNLTITKTVVGDGADLTQDFTFTVTLSNSKIMGTYGDMTFVNGVATVTMRAGQSRTATALPANTGFTVTEINTPSWFAVGSTGDKGTIVADQTATAAFTNTYEPKPTSAQFGGEKIITGPWPVSATAPVFEFTLSDETGVIETVYTTGAEHFDFKAINYNEAGDYTYTVKEVPGQAGGFTYDDAEYTVTVHVTDDHKGQLHAGVEIVGAEDIVFTNPYKPAPATAQFGGSKEFTGPWPEDVTKPTFNFTLSNAAGEIQTVSVVGSDSFMFDKLSFDAVGEYKYTVKETVADADVIPGIVYDLNTYTVTVTVTDAGYGQLEASVDGADKIVFTNKYEPKPATAQFGGSKEFTGPWPADVTKPTFEFTLSDASGVIDTKTTVGAGEFTFKTLSFDKVGEYTYTVKETVGDGEGITYDTNTYTVTVKVTDAGRGQLAAEVTGAENIKFTNEYKPEGTDAQFGGKKIFNGPWPEDVTKPTFEFTLSDASGVIDTKTTVGSGSFTFDALSFDKVGVYTYTVKETVGTAAVKYDTKSYEVTVTVTDDGTGKLAATVKGAENIVFTNEYNPEGTNAQFGGKKVFNGPWPEDVTKPTFEFTLSNGSEIIDKKSVVGDGEFTFEALSFDKVGEYKFTVKETVGEAGGVKYDTKSYEVTVTVTDDGTGKLDATVKGAENIVFTNEYNPEGTNAQFGGKKVFDGPWPADVTAPTFTFTLTDASNKVVDTKTTVGAGTFTFEALSFDKVGVYIYTVAEKVETAPGVTYDEGTYTVTVTVTDDGTGALAATVEGAEDIVFTNTYESKPVSINLSGEKEFTGVWPEDVELPVFTFTLSENGAVIDTKTTEGADKFAFDTIEYTEVGEHIYTVKEVNDEEPGITYDMTEYTVVVKVSDIGDGELHVDITVDGEALATDVLEFTALNFTNDYTPASVRIVLSGEKEFTGVWPEDVELPEFTFLLDEGELAVDRKTTIGADKFVFDAIEYTEVGEHVYTVKEDNGGKDGFTYDMTKYEVTVKVTDVGDGQLHAEILVDGRSLGTDVLEFAALNFTNDYTPAPVSIKLSGEKEFTGVWPEDVELPEFTFLLDEGELAVDSKTTIGADKFVFDAIEYTEVGEHVYTVKEDNGGKDGFTYDMTKYEVTVKVTDVGDGYLHAEILVDGRTLGEDVLEFAALNFTNDYTPAPVTISLGGEKEFTGAWPEDVELPVFTFTLSEDGEVIDTKTTVGADTFTFDAIEYTEVGKHNYTVEEINDGKDGFTYDMTKYEIEVVVTDIGDGYLHVDITVDGEALTHDVLEFAALNFTNDYTPAPVSIDLRGEKEFTGVWPAELETPVFTFTLSEDGEVIDTKTTVGADKFAFDTIEYTVTGKHVYTVEEVNDGKHGFTYDMTSYEVVVDVTDIGDGYLHVDITVNGEALEHDVLEFTALDFTNDYTPDPVSVPFGAGKTLEGREIAAGEFVFEVVEDGDVVLTAENDEDGNIDLGEITYDVVGVHNYIIREVKGDEEGVTYDETEYEVTVTVTDIGDGYLHAAITGDTVIGTDLKFSNKYKGVPTFVTFEGMKTLTGRDLADKEFTFILSDDKGNVLETVKNGADGKISFSTITYTDEGVFNYTVKEIVEDEHGVYYDETVYNLTVTVVDNMIGKMVATISGDSTTGKDLNFLNEYKTGMLKIWKTVTGEDGELDRYFTFIVEFDDDGEYPFYGAYEGTVKSGDKIRLKHNQAIIIYDLPARITYTVTEEWAEGYRMSHMGAVGEILPFNMVTARFFNFKGTIIPKTGDESNIALWTALLIASMGGVVGTSAVLLKKRKEDE